MDQTITTQTRQQVVDRIENKIEELTERLDFEKEHHKQLFYEELIVSDMIDEAETIEEAEEWEMEQKILNSMMKMTENEIDRLENELHKQFRMEIRAKHG